MRRLPVFVLMLVLPLLPAFTPEQGPQEEVLALVHVTVIPVTGAPAAADMTLVIADGRISALGKTGQIIIPERARLIDATGKFLIPGLWDMHIHILSEERVKAFFPILIAKGVTGIRDMGGAPEDLERIMEWRKQVAEGTLLGPRIIAAGPIVDGPKPTFPSISIAVGNEAEGRQAVSSLRARGADFIKVYSLLPRPAYFAIADEARRQGVPFAGHVPESISAAEASDAGQKSIEHLSGVRLACSSIENDLRRQLLEARESADPSLAYQAMRRIYTEGARTYSKEKADALFARFIKNGTWQVPTLTVAWGVAAAPNGNTTKDSRSRRLASAGRLIKSRGNCQWQDETAETLAVTNLEPSKALELIAAMREAGVEFMAGTDAPNPWIHAGSSLHEELSLLVIAGFTPMEALEAATRNPAKYLGLLDWLGTVEQGKLADLVLLEANPLENISNTRMIWAVIVRGKLLPKPELKLLESRAEFAIGNSGESVKAAAR